MKSLARSALSSCAAAAMLGGCGGSQPPIDAPGAMPQSQAVATPDQRDESWMLPGAKSEDLLYVTDLRQVHVFSYPSGKPEGALRGFQYAIGTCVDSSGNVYITDEGLRKVFEFFHGETKPERTIQTGTAFGCSVDPMTGDLAVANAASDDRRQTGYLEIFKNARGKPKIYHDPAFQLYYFCGYDANGNLFVDGNSYPRAYTVVFAELPRDGNELETIVLNHSLGYAGAVQWDGAQIAITDPHDNTVDEFAIDGRQGTLVGTTALDGATFITQPWIQGQRIIVPNAVVGSGSGSDVLIYKYPAGGTAIEKLSGHFVDPQGATVSNAPT